jgi:hypothetical protein
MSITGYASSMSVLPGAPIGFFLSTDSPGQVSLAIQRVGATLTPGRATFELLLGTQLIYAPNPWEGYEWSQTFEFTVHDRLGCRPTSAAAQIDRE